MSEMTALLVYALRLRSETARLVDKLFASIGYHRRFHSSKGQDRWIIEEVFLGRIGGFFVEVGAGDGRTHSNTFVLERDYGWNGILIEADAVAATKIGRYRHCVSVCACVDSTSHPTKFLRFGHLGGIVAEDTDNAVRLRRRLLQWHSKNVVEIETVSLEAVLELNAAPSKIDYLSIDVEGAEHRVLATFPFNRYSFKAITVERPTKAIHEILTLAGYVLSHVYRYDGFYLAAEEATRRGIEEQPFTGITKKHF